MMNELNLDFPEILQEKWIIGEESWQKLWWSDSVYEFKNLLRELAANKSGKGYRLVVGEDTYAVASAANMDHWNMEELLEQNYLPVGDENYTLGIPNIKSFDEDNYEIQSLYDDVYLSGDTDFTIWDIEDLPPEGMSKEEFFKWFNAKNPHVEDEQYDIAVCDGFEISLYRHRRRGKGNLTEAEFKQTALGKALGNMFKCIR